MKTMGLLGGTSWESTLVYYRALNQEVRRNLGGMHSAKLVMHSVDFGPMGRQMQDGDWPGVAQVLIQAALGLKRAGADFLLLCSNTTHAVAPQVERESGLPLLHMADALGQVLAADGVGKVGLLGTSFTMSGDFITGGLRQDHGLEVLLPDPRDFAELDRVIFGELVRGRVEAASRAWFLGQVEGLAGRGAEAVILGCTEFGLLVGPENAAVRLYDSALVHARRAVELALD